ncbi:MAG: hypothetical protein WBL40_20070 [Terrimicrobiaceae bacterium]
MKTCQMTGIAKNDKGKAVCDPPKFKFVGLEKERPRRLLLGTTGTGTRWRGQNDDRRDDWKETERFS